jgi:hypothetical protein
LVDTVLSTLGLTLGALLLAYALKLVGTMAVFFAGSMNDHQLQITGLILTLLGIATQFVPPVLDLLNIPIR